MLRKGRAGRCYGQWFEHDDGQLGSGACGRGAVYSRMHDDRAGLGESDPGPLPKTSQQIADELYSLLKNIGAPDPYVMVGHSIGGLNVRLFASEHPKEIVGMVLVDASNEDEYFRIAALLPPDEREKYLRHEGGGNYEKVDLLASAKQIKRSPPLPVMPFIVLTSVQSGRPPDETGKRLHLELQLQLARLSPNAQQTVIKDSGHFIQLDQPQAVIDAIRSVVGAARERR